MAFFLAPSAALAEDAVVIISADGRQARRQGTIVDYTGTQLKLRTTLGADETIPAARIVSIETTWTAAHEAGRAARQAGNLDEAIAQLLQAKRDERRPWGVRQAMADLAGCYLEAGRIDDAGDEFLAIVASDPATRHFDIAPIAWRADPADASTEARASAWLAMRDRPSAAVLGASWLLSTAQRSQAAAALNVISQSADEPIGLLARIQLWRLKVTSATAAEADAWQKELEAMPRSMQAAGWYILGDIFAQQDRAEAAALAYMKVPILFREQRAISADAFVAAGKQLEKLGQREQAAGLYREVLRDFAHLPAAKEAGGNK